MFSIDRIKSIKRISEPIKIVDESVLKDFTQSAYGIFSGKYQYTAELEFTAERAKWIADETWHVDQQGQFPTPVGMSRNWHRH